MTIEDREEYIAQIDKLWGRLNSRNEKTEFFKKKLENMEDFDFCIHELDKLRRECKLDQELRDDLINMLEVEHFLENGNGLNFDSEY